MSESSSRHSAVDRVGPASGDHDATEPTVEGDEVRVDILQKGVIGFVLLGLLAVALAGTGLVLLVLPWTDAEMTFDEWLVPAGIGVALLGFAWLTAQPIRAFGRRGEAIFTRDGLTVVFPALMDATWFVPTERIDQVACSAPSLFGPGGDSLGVLSTRHTVRVTFTSPSERIPIRGRFFLFALVGARSPSHLALPNTTVDDISWRSSATDHASLEAEIVRVLSGAPRPTYRAGRQRQA